MRKKHEMSLEFNNEYCVIRHCAGHMFFVCSCGLKILLGGGKNDEKWARIEHRLEILEKSSRSKEKK